MRAIISTTLMLFCTAFLWCQTHYPASAIPSDLLKNADAVVRVHELSFVVLNKGEAIETEHLAVTLLNKDADRFGEPVFYYYEFVDIVDIQASVYDAAGNLVRNLKKKDIADEKPLDYFVNDFRYKVLRLPASPYPYTVEYSVTKKYKGLMFYPRFQPQSDPSVSVEFASFELTMPPGLEVRTKEVNLPEGSKTGPNKWELRSIPAFRPEPFSTKKSSQMAEVITAPTEFVFGGVAGDMRTWESFGAYMNELNKTQAAISPELKQKLVLLVESCPDDYCKIQRVYEYLQSNTRYYYVGMGIGGWQPAPAAKVDQYKYGDCKGLSNYTVSMLNAVGVTAHYALIRAGRGEQSTQFPEFPNAFFNHAIVCVFLENDTMWLECTSQTESCGFMGDFTDNRTALVVTPTGGKIMRTPKYDESKNVILRETNVQMQADGSAKLQTNSIYSGISQDLPAHLEELHDEKRKEYLYKVLNFNNFEIVSLSFKRNKGRMPSVEQNMELSLPNFAAINGKRQFFPMNLLAINLEIPLSETLRQSDFQPDTRGRSEIDSITITIPSGYILESNPEPFRLTTKFGTFENTVTSEGKNLVIKRKLVLNATLQPKEEFPEFIAFLKAITKADKAKLVLLKEVSRP